MKNIYSRKEPPRGTFRQYKKTTTKKNKLAIEYETLFMQHINSKRKFQKEIKAKKKPIFLGHPNSGSCVQNA